MKTVWAFLILLVSVFTPSRGQSAETFSITHGPWLQNVTESGITVMWTTSHAAVPGILISDDGVNYRLVQNSTDGMINAGDTLHKVRLTGLKPATRYHYKVYSRSIDIFEPYKITFRDTLVSGAHNFVTSNPDAEQISFIVLNDVHEKADKMAGYINSRSLADPDLWFFNGDMIDYLQRRPQIFDGFLDTAVYSFAKSTPFIYVRGNHEARGQFARSFRDYFDFPGDKFFGSFKMGPVQFLVLDCGEDKPDDNQYYYQLADYDRYRFEQLEWLKKEIVKPGFREAPFRIVIIHMPVIGEPGEWHGMRFLSEHYGPVLAEAGIDLMISGHTHRFGFTPGDKAGFGYPVLVASNNNFIEVTADGTRIVAVVRDTEGGEVFRGELGKR